MTFSRRRAEALQAGDKNTIPSNFESLFQQHWARVCRVLYRLVGDWAEAEDLALDTFWRLYRRPPGSDQNLSAWLYRVATNLGFNALRARKRRQVYEQAAGLEALDEGAPHNPAALAEQAQERQQVRRALAQMKPRAAQLLILRHSGLSYAEIAASLQISPTSVGTLLARAEKEFEAIYRRQEGR